MELLKQKYSALLEIIRNLESVTVAFSGGVDSSFLLVAAREALGEKASAVICRMKSFQLNELDFADQFCKEKNIPLSVIDINELSNEDFCANPPDRCYICKKNIFSSVLNKAYANNSAYVIEGSNADDVNDYRPGMRALKELGIISPLREAGFTKDEVRRMSEILGLSTWNKPSLACLSTRIPYGERITEEKLLMAGEAENYLRTLGFSQIRVRIHDRTARIEIVPDEFLKLIENREAVTEKLKNTGFSYVTLDLQGFRSGSLNETLNQKHTKL